jgi:glycerol-3-phosphate O-acyltransferase / dihydroxyacetone phosphate acyltransferase
MEPAPETAVSPEERKLKGRAMNAAQPLIYRMGRWTMRVALWFYFPRIETFHRERIPTVGPVLFTSNHPNSLTDAFVIGAAVPRKVNFVATVQLFRWRPVSWLLSRCGVIPINRVKDDPRAMRSVLATFEACFKVLERGEAIGIFPEGITHDDPQLKTVKTGAARMALELEDRHNGALGLKIVPVGLTFSAKERYRSKALVNFGEPIRVSDFLPEYAHAKHGAIQKLITEVEHRIQRVMYHLPHLERARVVEAVKRLYLDKLWVGNTVIHEPVPPQAGELLLTQAIAEAVERTFARNPARAAEFVRKLDHYEGALKRMRLSDDVLAQFPEPSRMLVQSLGWLLVAVAGAPIAIYGWAHRLLPFALVQWIVTKTAKQPRDRTHVSTATILAGLVIFAGFYALCVLIFHLFFGLTATIWYAVSLPAASLVAHYYLREVQQFIASSRAALVLLQAPRAIRRLLAWRAELIALIEAERHDYLLAKAGEKGS